MVLKRSAAAHLDALEKVCRDFVNNTFFLVNCSHTYAHQIATDPSKGRKIDWKTLLKQCKILVNLIYVKRTESYLRYV